MKNTFTAIIKQDQGWWIGWIQEIPGVNSQGKTRAELLKNLRSALKEALEFNREDAIAAGSAIFVEETDAEVVVEIETLRDFFLKRIGEARGHATHHT